MRSKLAPTGHTPLAVVMIFFLLVVGGAFYTELFQTPEFQTSANQFFRNPIDINSLANTKSIRIKNTLGEYQLVNKGDTLVTLWGITTPRSVPAKSKLINNMIQSLSQLKVRRTYPNDAINKDHFYLSKPAVTITLGTSEDPTDQDVSLSIGLINPIDSSAYISLSNSKLIYQINTIRFPFETIEFTDLIDSRVFPISKSNIAELGFIKGANRKTFFKIKRYKDMWTDSQNFQLSQKKVDEFLRSLLDQNALVILDQASQNREEVISNYLKDPVYHIYIKSLTGQILNYQVSRIVHKSYSDLKIERRQSILIKQENMEHPYLIPKTFLNLFYRTEKFMRDRKNPKRLF